jgi:hypothetical protein
MDGVKVFIYYKKYFIWQVMKMELNFLKGFKIYVKFFTIKIKIIIIEVEDPKVKKYPIYSID